KDAYSPFPIHGIEKVIGIPWTRLAICSFLFGITGTSLALLGAWYFMIEDWPTNIGGKPNINLYHNLPAFIPITFEFTILLAAHGMAITYLLRNWTLPGIKARNPHPRTTDDHFALEVHPADNTAHSEEQLRAALEATKPVEVFEKTVAA
ncbi:MAG: DUF3341 domain-containing protein, partial [Bacteroidota bacterium]